jgi:hypothetical protein
MCGSDDVGFLRSVKQSPCHRLPLFKFPCVSRSWIGSVGCWLSHDWIDAFQVTSKAAKRDDASIAVDMWDKRLLLLYPKCLSYHLNVLCSWLLTRVRRFVCRSLCRHLSTVYGPTWFNLLLEYRKRLALVTNVSSNKDHFVFAGDRDCLQGVSASIREFVWKQNEVLM